MTAIPVYIFDLDGTLADTTHRQHFIAGPSKDWDAFFEACDKDPPIQHVCEIARLLKQRHDLLFVSGRSDQVELKTRVFLIENIAPNPILYMRKRNDYRPDEIIKGEMLDRILAEGYAPIAVFDDRAKVCKMWRARGIPCFQVAEGDF
jgi:phosphoglycolate phosphatase-like HAD superfamily hydrolase